MTEGRLRVLVLNPGSSSLKASVLDPPNRNPVAEIAIDWGADASRLGGRGSTVGDVLRRLDAAGASSSSIDAVGYRVVHGGASLTSATEIEDAVVKKIEALADLAPLHNQIAAETIRAARKLLPGVRHVATFDTAFHASLSAAAYRYPVPEAWFREWGIRRFGFHGLSVEWSVRRAAELLDRPAGELRLVVAHLGSGCSVTAVDGGRSVATSMGMTPLEGLMMGTRAGSIDPGIILELVRSGRLTVGQLADALDHGSGLLGVSGRSADVRELEKAEAAGDPASVLALELFVARAAAGIAAVATALPLIDGIVFTGGIGEHAGVIRKRIVDRLGILGVESIHPGDTGDAVLTAPRSAPAVLRVGAREDVVVAETVGAFLGRT
ncbi:MAG TPA: acetate/propionate family kinase [Candidatus Limnocylindrales bacterium]|nr:acetate/propionate family kinase [Candidatus Limnocylindrales bacterium]